MPHTQASAGSSSSNRALLDHQFQPPEATPERRQPLRGKLYGMVQALARGSSDIFKRPMCLNANDSPHLENLARKTPAAQHPAAHHLRSVTFSTQRPSNQPPPFPFGVTHRFTGGVESMSHPPTVASLMPQLRASLSSKQGFVYIRDANGLSPVEQYVEQLRRSDAIPLGHGCSLVGAFTTPPAIASVFSPQWTFQVYDANLQYTFDVPVTEIPLVDLPNPNQRAQQLMHIKDCMDSHLRSLPDTYKDSPQCPSIICPQYPRIAQLVTAQEECLGRQFRGELNCRHGGEWIGAVEELLPIISPEKPQFRGEESCDVETFFVQKGIRDVGMHLLPPSLGNICQPLIDGACIRGFKRHLLNRPAQAEPKPEPARPVHRTASATPWLDCRDHGLAFKTPVEHMQCGTQAINGFFQQHRLRASAMAAHVAARQLDTYQALGLPIHEQKGFMHPKLLRALFAEKPVQLTQQEFIGNDPQALDMSSELTRWQGWQQLVNASPAAQGKNWINHRAELMAIRDLVITPDMWLAAQRGIDVADLKAVLNTELERNHPPHLPSRLMHLDIHAQPQTMQGLESFAMQSLAQGKDCPIIVRTGRQAGHFLTIVPDRHGNWLSLNSDGTQESGVQRCKLWCRAGELAQSFRAHGVGDVLIDEQFNRGGH
ncbi:hypothetical protein NQT62_00830 [Limnobacter humi]|uniref:Peptidase C58 YopT-type domain-containing protein n=1 Tax=Limnobacter humi TaxID=1778671 RepID=A0ABT1WD62_9BURK|nr:hypothetical protein [Limnobacter humi]MCQ8894981.1 hypothetical protein [Limnobacter humi]